MAALKLPHTVAIASEKVEGLCALYRDLQAEGVPAEDIGLWHSYAHDPDQAARVRDGEPARPGYASEPCTDGDLTTKRYLLVTHSRVKSGADVKLMSTYKDIVGSRPRSVVLWDEALLSSKHTSIHWPALEQQLGGLLRLSEMWPTRYEHLLPTIQYLSVCSDILKTEYKRQALEIKNYGDVEPLRLTMPEEGRPSDDSIRCLESRASSADQLVAFLQEAAVRPLRVAYSQQGLITFSVAVPSSLDRVAILDASAPIRDLMKADPTIKTYPTFDGKVVSYEDVIVHAVRHRASRTALEAMASARFDRGIIQDVVKVVLDDIPEDEAVVIFTFKTKNPRKDVLAVLKRTLESAGVNLNATVEHRKRPEDEPVKRPRIVFLTWGQETSISHFQYAKNVILCGILERSDWDIAGAYAGQTNDLGVAILPKLVQEIKLSEQTYITHQALCRGACRVVRDGKASPMRAWLFHTDPAALKESLNVVMPGADWRPWRTEHGTPDPHVIKGAAEKIRAYLSTLAPDLKEISLRAVYAGAGIADLPGQTKRLARDEAIEGSGWSVSGQWLIRPFTTTTSERTNPS